MESSELKIYIGIERSPLVASCGFLLIKKWQQSDLPLTISGPSNSLSLFAQVIPTPFCSPYSLSSLDRTLLSPIYSMSSLSFKPSP